MKMEDVLYTLHDRGILQTFYNQTQHPRLPPTYFAQEWAQAQQPGTEPRPNDYRLVYDREVLRGHLARHDAKAYVRLEPDKLRWTPFLLARPRAALETSDAAASHTEDAKTHG